jgi:hypothetical protein
LEFDGFEEVFSTVVYFGVLFFGGANTVAYFVFALW